MRPAVIAPPAAAGQQSGSLLNAWNDVRQWRKLLIEAGAEQAELIHAHSFASGMAAVRNWSGVVYDLETFVENAFTGPHIAHGPQSWVGRSFRVAEQFVISRAAAVVVHTHAVRAGVLERGAASENVFMIPAPLEIAEDRDVRFRPTTSPVPVYSIADLPHSAERAQAVETILQSAALVDREVGPAIWWFEDNERSSELGERAEILGIDLRQVVPGARTREADVVITFGGAVHPDRSEAVAAMLAGRPLLAADVDGNRDITPEGAGCLWFRSGDVRELAGRAIFLARNAEFCNALGDAGRRYLSDSRTPYAIARQYDVAYRHAAARCRNTPSQPFMASLQPLQCLL
jgi:hypothetical protein